MLTLAPLLAVALTFTPGFTFSPAARPAYAAAHGLPPVAAFAAPARSRSVLLSAEGSAPAAAKIAIRVKKPGEGAAKAAATASSAPFDGAPCAHRPRLLAGTGRVHPPRPISAPRSAAHKPVCS